MTFYNDNDPSIAAWLRDLVKAGLVSAGEVDERSIRDLGATDLLGHRRVHLFAGIGGWDYALQLAGWPADRPVWTGSCPCQPFSQSGKGKGFADDRHLWPDFARLIGECRPDTIFGEQVTSPDGYAWLDLVCADLEGMGYACGTVVTPAAGYGAPHARHRIYWVADSQLQRTRRGNGQVGTAEQRRDRPAIVGSAGLLADSDRPQRRANESAERAGEGRDTPALGGCGEAGAVGVALGDTNSAGPQERPEPEVGRRDLRIEGSALGAASPLRGFWGGADWLYCRDGKYRAVEAGTFPLATGLPARVVRLRGYGNSIVPQAAAAFVKAFLETETEAP